MPSMMEIPSLRSPELLISSGVNVAETRASRCVAKFDRILNKERPDVMVSNSGASSSAIVFTAFAPIASRQSTWM